VSWNFDASVEFYPTKAAGFAIAAFDKEIDDDFVSTTSSYSGQQAIADALLARGFAPGTINVAGLNRLDISTTINGGSSYIRGIELSGQAQFVFLPSPLDGFGASASATFLKGRTKLTDGREIPVQEQPTRTYAFSLFFQKWGVDASVSYKWNRSYLTDLNDDPDLNLDQGEFGRWDARISYAITPNIRVFAEGVNLNNEPTSEFQGGNKLHNTEYEYVGRTYFLGLSAGF
jgi:TonB-dependent receptor